MVRVRNPEKELLKQKLSKFEGLATWLTGKEHLGKREQQVQKLQGSHMSGMSEEQQGDQCNGSGGNKG